MEQHGLTQPYCRVWRPGEDSRYCLDHKYASDLGDLCGQYAEIENALRALLEKHGTGEHAMLLTGRKIYKLARSIRYELDHSFTRILKANSYPGKAGRYTYRDFTALEKPLRLSEYRVSLPNNALQAGFFRPFFGWTEDEPDWYRGNFPLLNAFAAEVEGATLLKVLAGAAALRCVLYAQFGENLDLALAPRSKKEGTGYFTAQSIFPLKPPAFLLEECYNLDWEALKREKKRYKTFF